MASARPFGRTIVALGDNATTARYSGVRADLVKITTFVLSSLSATVAGVLVVEAAINHHANTIPVVLVLSLLAFAGTVAIARFVAAREGVVGSGPDGVDGLEGDAPSQDGTGPDRPDGELTADEPAEGSADGRERS